MFKKFGRSQCQIKKLLKVICPLCNRLIEVPMYKAVNGELIECPECKKNFIFRKDT
ncbi:hypothetical protein [Dendrosporobacter sp. 1207_IL3150]|uniref:hypothetical protein n=1 Tax=Dendrosporobacter sp. 1207_IL3150 TaxID=3084054 RepID=UPI002FDA485B